MREIINWVDKHDKERRLRCVEFLSDDWYEAANGALKGLDVGATNIVIAHISELQSHYIVVEDGKASVEREMHRADVTLRLSSHTAESIREGSLSALTAIQEGLIAIEGDIGLLIAAREAVATVDKTLADLT